MRPEQMYSAGGGLQDAADDLQQSAFAGAVRAEQREYFTFFDAQIDVA